MRDLLHPIMPIPKEAKKPSSLKWQIRKSPELFKNWWTKLDYHSLFFDGPSKGNSRLSRAGGVIFDPGGIKHKDFTWGLGRSTNNQAEWLTLLKRLEIAITLGIQDLAVFGDSLLVIREVRTQVRHFKRPSNKMQHIFNSLISEFMAVHFLHILCSNNHSADHMENKGIHIEYGFMACDGNSPDRCWIP